MDANEFIKIWEDKQEQRWIFGYVFVPYLVAERTTFIHEWIVGHGVGLIAQDVKK